MKRLLLLLPILGLLGCAPDSAPAPDFHVNLVLVNEEVSEDSNSTTETLLIEGYGGTYSWFYDGYHPGDDFDPDHSYDFTLTDEDLQMLTLLIRENGLLVSREATVNTTDFWSAFEVTWDITLDNQNATGHVVGDPLPDDEIDGEALPDESWYAAEQVMDFIRDKVDF